MNTHWFTHKILGLLTTPSTGRVDLYRQGCFVLESKQGVERKDAETLATKNKQKKFRTGTATRGTVTTGHAFTRVGHYDRSQTRGGSIRWQ